MAIDHETVTTGTAPEPAPGLATTTPASPIADTYRRLVFVAGLRPREAASLLGRLEGLAMVPGGWTLLEVERLLSVRALVAGGRLGS